MGIVMTIKDGRIKALRDAVVKFHWAEESKMGYEQCYYIGVIRRMKHLLIYEDGMTEAEVDRIEKEAKEKAC